MKNLFILATFFCSYLAQQLPMTYLATDDAYISSSEPNHNYGSQSHLCVSHEYSSLLKFDLDGTVGFFDMYHYEVDRDATIDDCNHWQNTVQVSLELNVKMARCFNDGCNIGLYAIVGDFHENLVTYNCPNDLKPNNAKSNCLAKWSGGDPHQKIDSVIIPAFRMPPNKISFDLTKYLQKNLRKPFFNVSFLLKMDSVAGIVQFFSKEATNSSLNITAPTIRVINPPYQVKEACRRYNVTVNGWRISYLLCTPASGFVHGVNPVNIRHGQPEWSYLWSQAGQEIANRAHRNVYIMDMLGSGYSDHVVNLTKWNYSLSNQTAIVDGFIKAVNMTQGGKVKIHSMSFEQGTLPEIYWASQHSDQIKSIIFFLTGYVSTCPWKYSVNANNPPPDYTKFGQGRFGLCQNETLVPYAYWDIWENCVYPSFDCACQVWGPVFRSYEGILSFFPVDYPPPPALIQNSMSVYPSYAQDPTCSTEAIEANTQTVPIPSPNTPLDSLMVNATIQTFMQNTNLPKLLLYADQAFGGESNRVQVARAREYYTNIKTACYGTRGSHLDHSTYSLNIGQIVAKYVQGVDRT